MSQGYEPEDIGVSDSVLLLRVLGRVPAGPREQRPAITVSRWKLCVHNKSIPGTVWRGGGGWRGGERSNQRKSLGRLLLSISRTTADAAVASRKTFLLPPVFFPKRFDGISFWLRNKGEAGESGKGGRGGGQGGSPGAAGDSSLQALIRRKYRLFL